MKQLISKEDFEAALKTIQRYYMEQHNKKECIDFYTSHVQPIKEYFN